METPAVRLRVTFNETQRSSGMNNSWVLIEPNQHPKVSDVCNHILHKFSLQNSCPNGIILSMEGFALPPSESTRILKDNDTISVERKEPASGEATKGADACDLPNDEVNRKEPIDNGVILLTNKVFDGKNRGYQSEYEEGEVVKSGQTSSKKKKASTKHKTSNVERKEPAFGEAIKGANACDLLNDKVNRKEPIDNGVLLLPNEEFDKEIGGYQSEYEVGEVVKSGQTSSKKRKASTKNETSKKKKQRSAITDDVEYKVSEDDNINDEEHHPEGINNKKNKSKKSDGSEAAIEKVISPSKEDRKKKKRTDDVEYKVSEEDNGINDDVHHHEGINNKKIKSKKKSDGSEAVMEKVISPSKEKRLMADQVPLKFVDSHNMVGYLLDPPPLHKEFKSMLVGLNTCRISHAIREAPVICKDLVTDFWNNASINPKGAGGAGTIESTIQNKKIIISEEVIREVLMFGDRPEYPVEFASDDVMGVLKRMGYEGSYPTTVKKLLPPYWRFLAHTFVSCMSGRKGGTDEIPQASSSAIVALVMDWDYNFSKLVFNEMISNLKLQKKKNMFLMYPRFLQMIFDAKHPDLERSGNTLDVKALGPNSFGLIKQTRVSLKGSYQDLQKKLVKFGKFAETEDIEDVDVVNAEVVEEHAAPNVILEAAFVDISDDEEEVPPSQPSEEPHHEAAQNPVPTPEHMAAIKEQLKRAALKPPQAVPVTQEQLSASDQEESDSASVPRKKQRRDLRPRVLIREPVQSDMPMSDEPVVVAQTIQSPRDDIKLFVSKETPVVGSSLAQFSPGSSSVPDKLAHIFSLKDTDLQTKGKGISFESEPVDIRELQRRVFELEQRSVAKDVKIRELDVRVNELERSNAEKDVKMAELEANLGGLTTLYFGMQQKLVRRFGSEFESSGDDEAAKDSGDVSDPNPSTEAPIVQLKERQILPPVERQIPPPHLRRSSRICLLPKP